MARLAGGVRRARGRRRDATRAAERSRARVDELLARAHRGQRSASSQPRPTGSRGCATAMAERFARGGRLIALGARPRPARTCATSPSSSSIPVIVGKRALPAIGLSREGGPLPAQVELLAEPDDIAIAFGARGRVAEALAIARGAGCLTIAFAPRRARSGSSSRRRDDPFVRQELVETLYHVLWELVHVFFEHRGLLEGRDAAPVHDAGASSFLYPFLGEQRARPRGGARRRARLGA